MVVLGCGGDESGLGRRYKVTGKVTYNGAPLPHGAVSFVPTKPTTAEGGRAAQGQIKDGRYAMETTGHEDGALPGEYDVAIVAQEVDMSSAASSKAEGGIPHQGDDAYQKAHKNAKKLLPTKFGATETSKLKAKVGTGVNEVNFDLKDD